MEKSEDSLPENFVWDASHGHYYGPMVCKKIHYKTAAVLVGILEVILLGCATATFISLRNRNQSVDLWVCVGISVILVFSVITTISMFAGIALEQPRLVFPQIAFLQIEIAMLMLGAAISIISMSFGIMTTHHLFGIFVRVEEMENDFGPIWPFTMGVLAFFSAAVGIWFDYNHTEHRSRFHTIVKGCYDFFLDKEYFTTAPNICMKIREATEDDMPDPGTSRSQIAERG